MKTTAPKTGANRNRWFASLLIMAFLAPVTVAADEPMVVYAQKPNKVRIRTSDIYSWTSDNDTSMVLTTKRRDQYLIEFERRCFNLADGPSSNALVTDTAWLDRNGYIRLLDRDLLPFGQLAGHYGEPFLLRVNSSSSLCAVKEITALGKKPRVKRPV